MRCRHVAVFLQAVGTYPITIPAHRSAILETSLSLPSHYLASGRYPSGGITYEDISVLPEHLWPREI